MNQLTGGILVDPRVTLILGPELAIEVALYHTITRHHMVHHPTQKHEVAAQQKRQ